MSQYKKPKGGGLRIAPKILRNFDTHKFISHQNCCVRKFERNLNSSTLSGLHNIYNKLITTTAVYSITSASRRRRIDNS